MFPAELAKSHNELLIDVASKLQRLEVAVETIGESVSHVERAVSGFPAGVELIVQDQLDRTMIQWETEMSQLIAAKILAEFPSSLAHTSRLSSKDELVDVANSTKENTPDNIELVELIGKDVVKQRPSQLAQSERIEVDFTATQSAPMIKTKMSMADTHVDLPEIELEEDSSLLGIFTNDTDVTKPQHRVEYYYLKKGMFQAIARSNVFANFTIFIVLLNALYLAVDSDHNTASNLYDAKWPFQLATQFFCTYFTIEILIRYLAFERKGDCMYDGWFKFDLFLVATMILDVWVIMVVLKLMEGATQVKIPTQPLRLLRLFKLTRMARLMKAFPELMVMIKGLIQSLRATVSSMVLLLVLIYTMSILFHLMLRDQQTYNKDLQLAFNFNFGTIGHCMWTLLLAGTLMLDNAAPLMTDMLFNDKVEIVLAGILFIFFTFISALLILQMLIGVLCDVVARTNEERRDATCIGLVKQELMGYLQTLDRGADGLISKKELTPIFEQANALALFRKLKINKVFFEQICHLTFHDEDSEVPIKTILELLLMCRGDNAANVNIIASTLCLVINHIGEQMNTLQFETHIKEVLAKKAAEEESQTKRS